MDDIATALRTSRSPTWVDTYIGRRIHQRRAEVRMSQTKLAGLVGVTFQQIQKFEKGINRVPASRLADIAAVLKASPGDFFPSHDNGAPHLRRGDLDHVMEAVAEQIDRQKALLDDLNRLYRRLSLLAMQPPTSGEAEGR